MAPSFAAPSGALVSESVYPASRLFRNDQLFAAETQTAMKAVSFAVATSMPSQDSTSAEVIHEQEGAESDCASSN